MAIKTYLAMTAAEFEIACYPTASMAWMACHFSPYETGLSNIPKSLPENSLLIVNDVTPIHNHDTEVIAAQLRECIERLHCIGVLLDFQRLPDTELFALTKRLAGALPCPTILPESLAKEFNNPVFLSPCPLYTPLQDHIRNWQDREIWLEIARNDTHIIINKHGTIISTEPIPNPYEHCFLDTTLNCHYTIHTTSHEANFHLWRTDDDMKDFLRNAEKLGIFNTVGLYQEFQHNP